MSHKKDDFNLINIAITTKQQITIKYNSKKRIINPYKLVNTQGTWYLVGDEQGVLKTYTFSKISKLKSIINNFIVNDEFVKIIKQNEATWFSNTNIDVTLQINISKLDYFRKKNLLPKQKIISIQDDNFTVTTQVSYDEEILSIVKYWIPYIKIVKPIYLKDKLKEQLESYQVL